MKLKINKFSIEKDCLPPAPGEVNSKGKPVRQKLYFDLQLKGFGLVVGKKRKTFIVQYDIQGHTTRVTIGPYGVWTVDQARKKSKELLLQMIKGCLDKTSKIIMALFIPHRCPKCFESVTLIQPHHKGGAFKRPARGQCLHCMDEQEYDLTVPVNRRDLIHSLVSGTQGKTLT